MYEIPHSPSLTCKGLDFGTGISSPTYTTLYEQYKEIIKSTILKALSSYKDSYMTTTKLYNIASSNMNFDGDNHPLLKRILVVPGIEELVKEGKIEVQFDKNDITICLKERLGHG